MLLLAAESFLPNAVLAVFGLLGFCLICFWLWMAADCLVHEPQGTQKSGWLLVILFGNWIGALFYFFIRRRERLHQAVSGPPAKGIDPLRPPPYSRSIFALLDAEIVQPPVAVPAVRASDWTYGRLLLIIIGVVVVLPSIFVMLMICTGIGMFLSSVRRDDQSIQDARRSAEQRHAEFEKTAAQHEEAVRKRASSGKVSVEPSGISVTAETTLEVGDEVFCEWGLQWYRATVLEVHADGNVKIHWQNWDDFFDEVVPRSRLQVPPPSERRIRAPEIKLP